VGRIRTCLSTPFIESIERHFKLFLFKCISVFFRKDDIHTITLENVRSILIVRQHNQLGDMLCAVPVFRALRQRFRDAHITLVASPANYEVVLNNPYLDEIVNYDKVSYFRSLKGFWRFCKKLREREYDLAIVPATVAVSVTSDAIAYLSGARIRIGANSIDGKKNPSGFLFNARVDLDWRNQSLKHQTERNLDIVRPFGIDTGDLSPVIRLTDEERKFADEFIDKNIGDRMTVIGFHPGAGKESNRWSAERFAQLADKLAQKFNALILVSQGPVDDELVAAMIEKLACQYVVLKPIREVAAVINKLSLFVTNDTGIMHVAAAMNTPVLSLFGPTDPLQWAPVGRRNKYVLGRCENVNSITVDKVYRIAVDMIKSSRELDLSE
jgi:ADP-heptose:LPS heptosyltransferase